MEIRNNGVGTEGSDEGGKVIGRHDGVLMHALLSSEKTNDHHKP